MRLSHFLKVFILVLFFETPSSISSETKPRETFDPVWDFDAFQKSKPSNSPKTVHSLKVKTGTHPYIKTFENDIGEYVLYC